MPIYDCDACGAQFEIDPNNPPEFGVFCPECGETELIKQAACADDSCNTDITSESKPLHG
jgi:DNA-directed RNA polymerase subunit RPC12/RpoP